MSKKKTNNGTGEDVSHNGPSSIATGDAYHPEAASPPLPEPSATAEEPPAPPLPTEPPPLPVETESSPAPVPPPMSLSNHDLNLAAHAPLAVAAPVAPVAVVAPDPAMEERLRRLEALLTQAQQNLQTAQDQRVTERTQMREPPAESGPSVFGQTQALLEVGRHLLPALPPGQAPPKPRGWLIWELIAELRAMACMYLDPRYRVSWWGYVLPPALLVAFLFTKFWFPFALMLEKANLAWLVVVPADLMLLYAMFKILGYEARRYRETAPDLPPSLRL